MIDLENLFLRNRGAIAEAARRSRPEWIELDDWAQEMMLRVWSRIHTYDPAKGRFTTWVYTIAFRYSAQQRQAHAALKRSAYRTKSIHQRTTIEPLDYRGETPDEIDTRLDIRGIVGTMLDSDQSMAESIMGGGKDSDYSRDRRVSRQRVCALRRRLLRRLHKKLAKTTYGMGKDAE